MNVVTESVDVLVIGGGTAGTVAAIQAARAGAKTSLIEAGPQLGGTITTGGVCAPAHFFCRTHQVIAGIGWELVTKTVALEGRKLPDYANPPPHRPSYHTMVHPALYAALAEETALAAGVRLHYRELPIGITRQGDRYVVESVGKNTRRLTTAREVIDTTGDADIVGMLGLPREKAETRQPGTLEFRFTGYDAAALDADVIQELYLAARRDGRLQPGDFYSETAPFIQFLQRGGCNQQHVFGADSSTADGQTAANIAGRQSLLRLYRFIRTLPGCENAQVASACTETAVRETYRIVGETVITYEDYMSGRRFDDAVCNSFYFIDVHTETGGHIEFLPDGVVPTIPLSALIPKGSVNVLTAGRTISADRLAFSALRVQASCMAMGQAVGAAAALACRLGVPSRDVPLDQLRALLREHQAIVP